MADAKTDPRGYLREQGFTVGARGRFSADMLASLAAAGVDTTAKVRTAKAPVASGDGEAGGSEDATPESPKPTGMIADKPNNGPKIWRSESLWAKAKNDGIEYKYTVCAGCHLHMQYCTCPNGAMPMNHSIRLSEPTKL